MTKITTLVHREAPKVLLLPFDRPGKKSEGFASHGHTVSFGNLEIGYNPNTRATLV